ncbi:ribonuclease P protein component, partial [Bacillus subtilis]
ELTFEETKKSLQHLFRKSAVYQQQPKKSS